MINPEDVKAKAWGIILLVFLTFTTMGSGRRDSFVNALKEGNRLYYAGRFDEALKVYTDGLTYEPSSPLLLFNIGVVRYQKGEYSSSEKVFSSLLEMVEPALRIDLLFNIGNSRYYRGDYRGAVASFKEVLRLNPGDMDARYNLELALRALKRVEREGSIPISSGHQPIEGGGGEVSAVDAHEAEEETGGVGGGRPVGIEGFGSISGLGSGTPLDEVKEFTEEEAKGILDGLRGLEMNALKEARRARIPRVTVEKDW